MNNCRLPIIDHMIRNIARDVTDLKEGLNPKNLAYWYDKVVKEAKEMAPPWLTDKINVKQDPILHMKFNVDISKRAVEYFIMAIDNNLDQMPYSTKLYFLKTQDVISDEMDKSLV